MKRAILALAACALVGTAALWLGMGPHSVAAEGVLPYRDAKAVAQGQQVYADHCAECHGADLAGAQDWHVRDSEGYLPAPPQDQTGHTWHHPDELLIRITTLGTEAVVGQGYKSRMIGFGDVLTEDEILSVLAYIKSTWPDEVIEMHNKVNSQ